ncbi:hypothetical protein VB636_01105, partial [Paracoccus sp. APAP_BH8]
SLRSRSIRCRWRSARICVDTALDAERRGATLRTYAEVTALAREGEAWQQPRPPPGAVRMEAVMRWLSDHLPPDAIIANGAGNLPAAASGCEQAPPDRARLLPPCFHLQHAKQSPSQTRQLTPNSSATKTMSVISRENMIDFDKFAYGAAASSASRRPRNITSRPRPTS